MNAMLDLSYRTGQTTKRRAVRKGTGASLFKPSTSQQDLKVLRAIHMLDTFDRITVANVLDIPFGTVSRVVSQLMNSGYVIPLNKVKTFKRAELDAFPWPEDHRHNYDTESAVSVGSASYEKTANWPKLMVALSKINKPKPKKKKAP